MTEFDPNACKITHYPSQVLAKKAEPVEKIDEKIKKLVERMTEIMIETQGIGLAAPQAGISLRLFIISLDGTKESTRVYINPTIETDGSPATEEEGCLSVPGVYTRVRRFSTCTVTATDLDGKEFTEIGTGLYARALQHEYDHIEGTVIVNRMGQAARIAHRKRLKELEERHQNPGS